MLRYIWRKYWELEASRCRWSGIGRFPCIGYCLIWNTGILEYCLIWPVGIFPFSPLTLVYIQIYKYICIFLFHFFGYCLISWSPNSTDLYFWYLFVFVYLFVICFMLTDKYKRHSSIHPKSESPGSPDSANDLNFPQKYWQRIQKL